MKERVSVGGGLPCWAHTSTEGFLLLQWQAMRIHPPTAAELFKILKAINCFMFFIYIYISRAAFDAVWWNRSLQWSSLNPAFSFDVHTPLHISSCILCLHNWSGILFFSSSPRNRQPASNRVQQKILRRAHSAASHRVINRAERETKIRGPVQNHSLSSISFHLSFALSF